jgi:HPt (histidine-containing phosphotransfer) domain-containing protein
VQNLSSEISTITMVAGSDPLLDAATLSDLERTLGRAVVSDMLSLVPRSVSDELERLDAALAKGDLESARRHIHTLKGFCGNLGLCRLSRAALRLERHLKEFPRTAPHARELAARVREVGRETMDALSHRY